jgi:hypothetical protein
MGNSCSGCKFDFTASELFPTVCFVFVILHLSDFCSFFNWLVMLAGMTILNRLGILHGGMGVCARLFCVCVFLCVLSFVSVPVYSVFVSFCVYYLLLLVGWD